MTASIQDLREAMDEFADEVVVPNPQETLRAVEAKLQEDRGRSRRNWMVAAVAAVALVLGAAFAVDKVWPNQSAPTPTELSRRYGSHLPAYTDGYKLIDVVEVPAQQGDVTLLDPSAPEQAAWMKTVTLKHHDVQRLAIGVTCTDMGSSGVPDGLAINGGIWMPCMNLTATGPDVPVQVQVVPQGSKVAAITDLAPKKALVPVGVYAPASWAEYPKPATVEPLASLEVTSPLELTTLRASGDTAASGLLRPAPGGDQTIAVTVRSGSAGRFTVLIDGAVAEPEIVDPALPDTTSVAPIWRPNGTCTMMIRSRAAAGHRVRVEVRPSDNKGAWSAVVGIAPRVTSDAPSTTG